MFDPNDSNDIEILKNILNEYKYYSNATKKSMVREECVNNIIEIYKDNSGSSSIINFTFKDLNDQIRHNNLLAEINKIPDFLLN